MKNLIKTTLLAACIILLAGCQNKTKNADTQSVSSTPKVKITQVKAEDVSINETYTATIEPNLKNNIVSQSSGRIKNIYVEVGNHVKKGQLVAEMDAINLQKTHLQMVNDSIELARLKELHKVGGVAQADYDVAVLGYELTKKTYANLLENTKLLSPINGIVTARNYDVNDMYTMSMPIFVVEQIAPVKILINVSESKFTQVHKGMEFDISVDAYPDNVFKGKINIVYPTINANTHTFPVEILVANADEKLRPGMYAKVQANYGNNYNVVVPDQAVIKQIGSGEHFIYVFNPDNNTVEYQKVELGKRMNNRFEILSGIQNGDWVVVEGQPRLKAGIVVEAVK